jgi:flagellar motor switch protein FliG
MTKATDATMRRIAIVLASLPESVAQRLLGSLPRENQRLVRTALGTLSEVDPLEQRRALDGFASSLRKDKASPQKATDAAEIVFSRAAIRNLNEQPAHRNGSDSSHRHAGDEEGASSSAAPLDFLLDVDDETLVAHLKGEMPQTLAIILASISPTQAARVLPRLDPAVRADAMRRIANLKELPADLIDDIGSQLRDRFSTYGSNGTGRRALEAIMAEMSPAPVVQPPAAQSLNPQVTNPATASPGFSAAAATPLPAARQASVPSSENQPAILNRPQAGEPAEAFQPMRLKVADGTWPESAASAQPSANRTGSATTPPLRATSPLDSTDATHAFLLSLPIDRLRESLGRSDTRKALLTLCGLPNSTAESLLASLPRRQAKQVREQLASLGSIELRDIDEAKSAIAKIAYQLGQEKRVGNSNASVSTAASSTSGQPESSLTAAAA